MTLFPQKTRCRYGGFGQARKAQCLATKSKAKKHRVFLKVEEFIDDVRACDDLQSLSQAQVDHVLQTAAVPVAPRAPLVCSECAARVTADVIEMASRASVAVAEPPSVGAVAEPPTKRRRTRQQCDLLLILWALFWAPLGNCR